MKILDTKGTFYAKVGSIKDRNDMNLTEAEDTKKKEEVARIYRRTIQQKQKILRRKKRWQEYTEELYKKDLHSSPL